MGILRDFFRGLQFYVYVLVKVDRFLFILSMLSIMPLVCLIEDLGILMRAGLTRFIFKRSLYIFSEGAYGNDYFVNKSITFFKTLLGPREMVLLYKPSFIAATDFSIVIQSLRKQKQFSEYYNLLFKEYREVFRIYVFWGVLFMVKMFLVPFINIYMWFVIPDRFLRKQIREKSFFYRFLFHNLELYQFKRP
jgi:hypothetical protein